MHMRLRNIRAKWLTITIVALLAITVGFVAFTTQFSARETNNMLDEWEAFDATAVAKIDVTSRLRAAFGHGAMNHSFNNFVVRKNAGQIAATRDAISDVRQQIVVYISLGTNAAEDAAMREISRAVDRYAKALRVAEKTVANGKTSTEIDDVIKIDGRPALAAISALDSELLRLQREYAGAIHSAITTAHGFIDLIAAAFAILAVTLVVGVFLLLRARAAEQGVKEALDIRERSLAKAQRIAVSPPPRDAATTPATTVPWPSEAVEAKESPSPSRASELRSNL